MTATLDALVERLREYGSKTCCSERTEAADAIAALRSENATLRAEIAQLEEAHLQCRITEEEQRDALRREVKDRQAIEIHLRAERDTLAIRLDNAKGQIEDAYSTLDLMRAEVEALRKDAERYRWLRTCSYMEEKTLMNVDELLTKEALDAAIDAAMKGGGE